MKKHKFLLLISLLTGFLCFSQIPPIKHFTTEDILPNNTVRSLLYGKNGSLWIGTDNGLVRKYNSKIQYFFEEEGLPLNNIWALAEDDLNNYWIGSYGNGIAWFNGKKFTPISTKEGLIHDEITSLFFYNQFIYVGTSDGISVINTRTKEILASFTTPSSELMRVHDFFEYQEEVFATTYSSGIYKISKVGKELNMEQIHDHRYIYASQIVNDTLFLSNKESIDVIALQDLVNHSGTVKKRYSSPSIFWNYAITNDGVYGASWGVFEESGGLYRYRSHDKNEKVPGISCRHLTTLAYDSNTVFLYAGSPTSGLYQINLKNNITFFPAEHEKMISIDHVAENSIRLFNDGLQINQKKFKPSFFENIKNRYVQKNRDKLPKHEDFFYELNYDTPASGIVFYGIKKSKTHVWINTNIGLYKFLPNGTFISYLPLHTLTFDFTPDNRLVETNPYHGVRVYSDEDALEYTYYDEHKTTTPTDVVGSLKTAKVTFFLSIFRGLFSYDTAFQSHKIKNLWKEEKLRYATEYLDGIAVSHEFGDIVLLAIDDSIRIKKTIPRKTISGNTISSLNSYNDWLIVTTEKGLTFLNDEKQIFIDKEQGLTKPVHASNVYRDTLFLASDGGEFRLDLQQLLNPKDRIDSLFLTHFFVNNAEYPLKGEKLSLKSTENHIKVGIETNAHPFPGKLSFQYKMKKDSDWQELDSNEIELYFLQPSDYTLFVRVLDTSTGQKMERELLSFTIKPPVYAQWWFLLLSGMSILGIGLLFSYYKRKQQQERAAKEIAFNKQIEKLKTDALLAQMNPHFIFNALNSIQHLIVLDENEKASAYLVKFAKLVRINLNNAERTFTTLQEELTYLKTYCEIENERHGNRIHIEFNIDPKIQPADVEIPTMVLQPFIENAFVHAFPPSITHPKLIISAIPLPNDMIQYTVQDNGIGNQKITKTPTRESKGIRLIKERLSFLGYDVDSALRIEYSATGTVVRLVL